MTMPYEMVRAAATALGDALLPLDEHPNATYGSAGYLMWEKRVAMAILDAAGIPALLAEAASLIAERDALLAKGGEESE